MSWQTTLQNQINNASRIALVGVGHPLRGDDALGVEIIRALQECCPSNEDLLLVEAGAAPENVTGILRRFTPDMVIFVDGAEMQAAAGSAALIDLARVVAPASSTHTLSLGILSEYLQMTLGCRVLLLGVQPANLTFGAALSPALERPLQTVIMALRDTLSAHLNPPRD